MKCIKVIVINCQHCQGQITLSSTQYINYIYDGAGTLVRKQQTSGSTVTTTDYVDGFVYINNTLSYFAMPEGRVLYNAGVFKDEFILGDQQGNARISFQDNGNGIPIVKQENSYYPTGLIMPNSPVTAPPVPNKNLYNGGSEWQNDMANNLPDYYETYFRNYDAAIARWVAVDPQAENVESLTPYNYVGNNPVMFNDPLGNLKPYTGNAAVDPVAPVVYPGYAIPMMDGNAFFADIDADNLYQHGSNFFDSENAWQSANAMGNSQYHDNGDGTHTGSMGAAIGTIYAMSGSLLGSLAGTRYTELPDGRMRYEYTSYSVDLSSYNGGSALPTDNFVQHSGYVDEVIKQGTLNYKQYHMASEGYVGNQLDYALISPKQLNYKYNFVQIVTITAKKETKTTKNGTFIDNKDAESNFPFYYTRDAEKEMAKGSGFTGFFHDRSHRDPTEINPGSSWSATLFIYLIAPGNTYYLLRAITYGFSIDENGVEHYKLPERIQ